VVFYRLANDAISILSGIQAATNAEVLYAPGCEINGQQPADFAPAIEAAKQAEVVIAAVGESARMSGEAASTAIGFGTSGSRAAARLWICAATASKSRGISSGRGSARSM
jgi:hypothetical protein